MRDGTTLVEMMVGAVSRLSDKAPLLMQALHLIEEPPYEKALRHVLGLAPEQCRELCERLEREYPRSGEAVMART